MVDYPHCRNDLRDQSKAWRPRAYCIPAPAEHFSRNDGFSNNVRFPVSDDVANAIYNATGKRIRELPITLDKVLSA
jgi:hypothetical protein